MDVVDYAVCSLIAVVNAVVLNRAYTWLEKNSEQHTLLKRLMSWLAESGNQLVAIVAILLPQFPLAILLSNLISRKSAGIDLWHVAVFAIAVDLYWFGLTAVARPVTKNLWNRLIMKNPAGIRANIQILLLIGALMLVYTTIVCLTLYTTVAVIDQIATSIR